MRFEMRGKGVEGRLDATLPVQRLVRTGAEPGEEGAAELVPGEDPVQIAAGDAAVGGAGALLAPVVEPQHRRRRSAGTARLADMHLVAPDRRTGGEIGAHGLAQRLL